MAIERPSGIVLERNLRTDAVMVRDLNAESLVTAAAVSSELAEGIILYTRSRDSMGVVLKNALEARGINADNMSFSGVPGMEKSALTIRGYSAEDVARILTENHPVYPDERCRSNLCSIALGSKLAQGYGPLREEIAQQEDKLRGVPFS